MTVADRIRILREKKGWSQTDLAKHMGLKSRSSVARTELAGNDITLKDIERIAKALDCSIKYLMGYSEENKEMSKIPILGQVAAGQPIVASEHIIGYEEIPNSMAHSGNYFALRIKGDSMEPDIKNNDIVIVRQTESADSDKIVIALVDGYDNAVCKRLKSYQNYIALISLNPNYGPMIFDKSKDCKIIGEVVQVRRNL